MRPLKNNSIKDTTEAFEDMFEFERTADIFYMNDGKEFTGNALKNVLDEKNINKMNEDKVRFQQYLIKAK